MYHHVPNKSRLSRGSYRSYRSYTLHKCVYNNAKWTTWCPSDAEGSAECPPPGDSSERQCAMAIAHPTVSSFLNLSQAVSMLSVSVLVSVIDRTRYFQDLPMLYNVTRLSTSFNNKPRTFWKKKRSLLVSLSSRGASAMGTYLPFVSIRIHSYPLVPFIISDTLLLLTANPQVDSCLNW